MSEDRPGPANAGVRFPPPLLFVVSRAADAVQGWRFDATTWDASVPPVEAARRSGRRAGFLLHPVEDFSAR